EGIFGTPTYAEYEDYIENIIVWSAPSYTDNPVVAKVTIYDPEGLSVVNDFLPITVLGGMSPNSDPSVDVKLLPADSVSGSTTGYSVDIYGNRIITSFVTAQSRGAVAVFEIDGNDYRETSVLHSPDQADKNYFGRSIAIDEDIIVVGAQMEDGGDGNPLKNCGAAYVYTRKSGGVWLLKNILYASDREMNDQFGSKVAIDSGIITVSSLYEDGGPGSPKNNCGAVYVYEQNEDNEWKETAILHGSDTMTNDYFGSSLAVDKNIIVVGAMNKEIGTNLRQGCVYIFQKDDDNEWSEKYIIVSSDGQQGDYFGSSLSISGNYIVIGAEREDGGVGDPSMDSGAVYIFKFDQQAENWILSSILRAPDNDTSDCYGTSVAVFSDIILISAAYDDGDPESGNTNGGALYAYRHLSNGVWSFLKKITSPDVQAYDYFGNSVAIHGNIAIAGAQGEDGRDGNPLKQCGAVYVIRF
ncbi:MAG: hypothetical protein JXJ04_02640, partial [Spirochaetales bacterium]|nr:hypothetical protein [Spirochaetales bacterium]